MSLKNTMTKNQGFTIVELLIVVIVIAILATITLVSFNNITSRANQSSADSAVATFVKKAELYQADGETGRYPVDDAALDSPNDAWHLTTGFTYTTATSSPWGLTNDNGKNAVNVAVCPAGATESTITGLRIYGWNYTGTVGAAEKKVIGTC